MANECVGLWNPGCTTKPGSTYLIGRAALAEFAGFKTVTGSEVSLKTVERLITLGALDWCEKKRLHGTRLFRASIVTSYDEFLKSRPDMRRKVALDGDGKSPFNDVSAGSGPR